jgi:hypothetical protein
MGEDSGSPGRRTDWEEREEVGEGSMQGHRGRKERKGGHEAKTEEGGRREFLKFLEILEIPFAPAAS